MTIMRDEHGFPILRLAAPMPSSSDPTKVDDQSRMRPSGDESGRRRDAVREAAREFETISDQDARERLRGVTIRPLATDEISAFVADVRAQQVDDMVDVLDQLVRGRLRARRTVRLMAPRGYVKRTLGALDDDELVGLAGRLRARGWDDDMVSHGLAGRVSAKVLDRLGKRL